MQALKIPPHNEEAEASVLGAILIDKDAITIVSELIFSTDFYNPNNAIIYDAMLTLYEYRKPIDIVTLTALLKKKKNYDKVGETYLIDLVNSVPTSANAEHYAVIIKEAATKRALIKAGSEIVELGFTEDEIKDVLNKAETSIFAISQGHLVRGFIQIKDALAQSFDR